ncbi:MAG: SDR family NAD(P)-dependent oxidoreductase [Gammaproteobacteria bacterium]|nr:SDR family NAD(P)-dependent oxidoreductase [Gammaproteobacteria bacterium]
MKQRVLITGGTGFLGRHLAHALKNDYEVFLGARNNKQNSVAARITGCEVMPLDICNMESVRDAVIESRPDIIIHAAATKFVDLSEKFPMECIDVNVTGSQNVIRVAVDKGVKSVIAVSTDKAAPPVRNTYGMSKALMERAFCSMHGKTATKMMCVRYGNVAWSTGSVLPIWKSMWEKEKLIGSTGPEMTRFFFTVNDAVNLVKTAMENIDRFGGMVLSREMKAAKVEDILNVWMEEYGGRWEKIQGRPGERNNEYLVGELELAYTRKIKLNNIMHYVISFNDKSDTALEDVVTSDNAPRMNRDDILHILNAVPEEIV